MRSLPRQHLLHTALATAFGTAFLWPVAAMAQTAGQSAAQAFDIKIPAQSLGAALNELSRQTGTQVFAAGDLVSGLNSRAVAGSFTMEQALRDLLAGTSLEATRTANGGFAIRRFASTQNGTALPTVNVTASRETASGPVAGFVAKRSATATKTDTALSETPQTVSVIPREQIEAQAADSLDQAVQYSAGVSLFEGGSTRSVGTRFLVRGFSTLGTSALYLNGSKFPLNSLSGSIEPYNYERVELLKGPASIMYGQATPGGVINLVSKRPTSTPLREVEVQAGSWDRKQIAVDLAGPVTEDGRIRYRLTGLQRDSNSMIKQMPNDRTSLSGALEWQLTNSTLVTLLATYNKIDSSFDSGKPLDGTLLPNSAGRIARDLFVGEPGVDKFNVKGTTLGYLLEHNFNDAWQFRQNLLAYDHDVDSVYSNVSARVNPARPSLGDRVSVLRADADKGTSLDNQLHGKLRHGNVEHNLLFGLDWSKSEWSRSQTVGALPPIDLFAPVYGARPILGPSGSAMTRSQQLGFYAQDQIKFNERWIALIGGRYDTARNDAGPGTKADKANAFTPRAALMYLSDSGFHPYYSYSRSFQPTSGSDFNLNRFKPTEGLQHEIGVKYEPKGVNASVTMAAYEITQKNVLTNDPAHVGSLVQTGEVRSRGLEIEGRAELDRRLGLIAAFSVTDAKVTQSNQGNVGTRPASVPRNMASLWADYRLESVPGMSIGFGVRRVGEQEVNRMAVPSFTVYDAALRYQWDKWMFALNIKNLADKNYIAACPSVCYYGDERNLLLTARYRW